MTNKNKVEHQADAEYRAGYRNGINGGDQPKREKGRSYWLGWTNGKADRDLGIVDVSDAQQVHLHQLQGDVRKNGNREVLASKKYCPNRLFNFACEWLSVKNDAALARKLDVIASSISKMRHRELPIGDAMLKKIHKATGKPIEELRRLAGV